jgi:hypothetical protein
MRAQRKLSDNSLPLTIKHKSAISRGVSPFMEMLTCLLDFTTEDLG